MNNHVLITGASRGIGRACAIAFAAAGFDLTVTGLNSPEKLYDLKSFIESNYRVSCRAFIGDISDYSDVCNLFKDISSLDVLINNAGISYCGLLQDMTPEEWRQVIDTNLTSAFYTCKLAIPLMLKKHSGKIINVSSVWGNAGAAYETAYSASKGGLNALTKSLAKELAPSNIQVSAVSFGLIDTDMNNRLSQEEKCRLIDEIPACRMGTPEEAAALILQIAQAPDYMTGQIVSMDGGWL